MDIFTLALLVCFATGALAQGEITGPQNTLQKVGERTFLNCSVTELEGDHVEWVEYITTNTPRRIYISASGFVQDHPRRNRYELDQSGGDLHFNLVIKSTQADDAGKYGCKRSLKDNEALNAELLVIDHFKTEVNATSTPAAGDTVSMLCSLKRYGNPTQNIDIGWLDGEDVMDGNLTKTDTMVVNEVIRTLTPEDNGKEYHCKQSFSATIASQPGYEATVVLGPLEVYFAPNNITLDPDVPEYRFHSRVNCSANGNPPPLVSWREGDRGEPWYSILEVAGQPNYTCTATNNQGTMYRSILAATSGSAAMASVPAFLLMTITSGLSYWSRQ